MSNRRLAWKLKRIDREYNRLCLRFQVWEGTLSGNLPPKASSESMLEGSIMMGASDS